MQHLTWYFSWFRISTPHFACLLTILLRQAKQRALSMRQINDVWRLRHLVRNIFGSFNFSQLDESFSSLVELFGEQSCCCWVSFSSDDSCKLQLFLLFSFKNSQKIFNWYDTKLDWTTNWNFFPFSTNRNWWEKTEEIRWWLKDQHWAHFNNLFAIKKST